MFYLKNINEFLSTKEVAEDPILTLYIVGEANQ